MNPELAFLEAMLPEPVFLLNRALRPYCLAHDQLLRRFNSPFLVGKDCTIEDLFFAVRVCSKNWRDGVDWARSPWATIEEEFGAWGKECGIEHFKPGEELPLVNTYYQYILDGLGGPKPEPVTKINARGRVPAGRTPGAPLDALLLWAASGKLGIDIDCAMNFPLPALKWLYCTEFEQQGRFKLPTERSRNIAAQMQAYAKKHGLVPIRLTPQQMAELRATGKTEVDNTEIEMAQAVGGAN